MDNIAILKYTVLIASAPIWWPFAKALWNDLKDSLREEGGLFGEPPHPRKLEEIRREKELQEDNLVHEPRVMQGRRSSFGNARSGGGASRGQARGTRGAAAPLRRAGGGQRGGFR